MKIYAKAAKPAAQSKPATKPKPVAKPSVKLEGFWYHRTLSPQYPKPVPNVLTETQAKKIFAAIKKKEEKASKILYRGYALSRIERRVRVGSATYALGKWRWPQGYAEHYVLKHRVKPSDEFLEFLGV